MGLGVGYGLQHVPAAELGRVFWVGNFAAPFIVLPLVAAWQFRRVISACVAGAVGAMAMVLGFYNVFAVALVTNSQLDLPLHTPWLHTVGVAYWRWLNIFILGRPAGTPWLSIACVVGLGAGYVAYRTRNVVWPKRLMGVAIAPVVESTLYIVGAYCDKVPYDSSVHNVTLWLVEGSCGAVLFGLAWVRRARN